MGLMATSQTEALALKLKSLGADADDLDLALQAVKHYFCAAPGADVVRAGDSVGRSTVLLAGMACIAVPSALTRAMDFSAADLVVSSLEEVSVETIVGLVT